MMDIWVCAGSYEGEAFATTHIQQKGALITAILDVCELLGVGDDEDMERLWDFDETYRAFLVYHEDKLKEMDTAQLIAVFGAWTMREQVWEGGHGYAISVVKTRLTA